MYMGLNVPTLVSIAQEIWVINMSSQMLKQQNNKVSFNLIFVNIALQLKYISDNLKLLSEGVEYISQEIKHIRSSEATTENRFDYLPQFPLKSANELKLLEVKCSSHTKMRQQMVIYF